MARETFKCRSSWSTGILLLALVVPLVLIQAASSTPSGQLIEKFEKTSTFREQREVAEQLVAIQDPDILPKLVPWLTHEDRHLRANAAYVFAKYGDKRGFDVICAILGDRSDRPKGQGVWGPISILASENDTHAVSHYRAVHYLEWQIPADRYYAVAILGGLGDSRTVPILIPLLNDEEVKYGAARSLAQIGDNKAVAPLIKSLSDDDPSFRVVVRALEKMQAREAIPALMLLLNDRDRSHVDDLIPVAEAAKQAIASLEGRNP